MCKKETKWIPEKIFSFAKSDNEVIKSLALFARHNPQPLFRIDTNGIIYSSNPALENLLAQASLAGQNLLELLPELRQFNLEEIVAHDQVKEVLISLKGNFYNLLLKGVRTINTINIYGNDITKIKLAEKKIHSQAEDIKKSIRYAWTIQKAMLSNETFIKKILPSHFIMYRPRNVVSGDFYWIKKIEDSIVIAIADCTGHGVPGAFMSMLGVAFLNEIVKPRNLKANEILNQLRDYVIRTLSNSTDSRADGMDMALCIIQPEKKTIQYAGANNPFILINDSGLKEIKADRMPVGKYIKQDKPFTLHEIPYSNKDCVYLFSDGFRDQLGGPDLLKYGSKNFKKLLVQIHNKKFNEQRQILNDEFLKWSENYHQIDDILVMGFKLP
ncbi:MAG: SpoIIE family protein phosphatase [Bacteroidales bacterium]